MPIDVTDAIKDVARKFGSILEAYVTVELRRSTLVATLIPAVDHPINATANGMSPPPARSRPLAFLFPLLDLSAVRGFRDVEGFIATLERKKKLQFETWS